MKRKNTVMYVAMLIGLMIVYIYWGDVVILAGKFATFYSGKYIVYGILCGISIMCKLLVKPRKTYGLLFGAAPICIFISMAKFGEYKKLWVSGILISLVICLFQIIRLSIKMYYIEMSDRRLNRARYTKFCVLDTLNKISIVFVVCVCIQILLLHISVFKNSGRSYEGDSDNVISTNVKVNKDIAEGTLYESHREELKMLKRENFAGLSMHDKANALQTIVNIECEYLSIGEIQLMIGDTGGKDVLGYYSHSERMICINKKLISEDTELKDLLYVVLHEVYHSYEHHLVETVEASGIESELLLFREIDTYQKEFDGYKSAPSAEGDAYEEYKNQLIEQHANKYASKWTNSYIKFINEIEVSE